MKSLNKYINESLVTEAKVPVNIDKILKEIQSYIDRLIDEETKGYSKQYIEFGDVSTFEYDADTNDLVVYAYGKAYGDSKTYRKELTKKDFDDFSKTATWSRNFRGQLEPYTTNEHGAVKITNMLKEKKVPIKKVTLITQND